MQRRREEAAGVSFRKAKVPVASEPPGRTDSKPRRVLPLQRFERPVFRERRWYHGEFLRPESETQGVFSCICAFDCRGRCPHRPGRTDRFYRNLRRIRSFSTGRCRHRPLRTSEKLHSHPPEISVKTTAFCRAEQSSVPANSQLFGKERI